METKTSFTQAHLENQLWANELEFYREELTIFERHLDNESDRIRSLQHSEKADLFRNQFTRQRELINVLEAEVVSAEKKMAIYVQQNKTLDPDEINVGDHQQFRERIESFKQGYQRLKAEYRQFEVDLK